MKTLRLCILPLISMFYLLSYAQTPMVKVDLNMEGRQAAEVNDPDYSSWYVGRVHEASMTEKGITFTLTAKGPIAASAFRAYWAKAYVQSPSLMKLIGDGLMIDKDTMLKYPSQPAAIELKISGLPVGTHTLQTYHNMWDDSTSVSYAPLTIYLNGTLIKSSLKRSVKATSKSLATILMTTLNVTQAGQDMILRIEADPTFTPYNSKTKDYNVCINGFELNTDDASKLSNTPTPANRDFHSLAVNGTDTLTWLPATNGYTKQHTLYVGTDSLSVLNATTATTDIFKGTFPVNIHEYRIENLYNLNTYYWRVDETDSSNVMTKGAVWSFRPQHIAFPGAEGYGRDAIGGRGGDVVYVTNLNDDGPGSFRAAVSNVTGPRTVVFAVSGLITLNSRLVINNPYITVAGQTAPGKGICFRWAPIGVTGNDLIVQNIRMRLGIGITYDGMGLTGSNHSIIDHCSISWTIDEAFSSRGAHNITLQNTLISEALNSAGHSNYPDGTQHGYAGSVGGDIGSLHHNFLAHCQGRNWSMAGGLDGNGYYSGKLDIFNMVVYNWGGRATDGGANQVNFVNNYYKKGPSTTQPIMLKADLEGTGKGSQSYYFTGNIEENTNGTFACDGTDNTCARTYTLASTQVLDWTVFVNNPFFPSYATITSAKDAYKSVLSNVGCNQPTIDDHDKRVIQEALTGTTTYTGSRTGKLGIPDNENDVGGWENYPGYTRASNWDTDLDGLPDWWETAIGTSPNSASGSFADSNADTDKNGYTNMEEYLHWMNSPHHFVATGNSIDIDLKQYAVAYTKSPVFTIKNIANCSASLTNGTTAHVTATQQGLASFTFEVTDADGATKSQKIGLFSGTIPADSPFSYTYYKDRALTQLVSVGTTGINETTNDIYGIRIIPNQVKDMLKLSFESETSTACSVTIYNLAGQLVFSNAFSTTASTNQLTVDTHTFASGAYTLKISNHKTSKAARFIKL